MPNFQYQHELRYFFLITLSSLGGRISKAVRKSKEVAYFCTSKFQDGWKRFSHKTSKFFSYEPMVTRRNKEQETIPAKDEVWEKDQGTQSVIVDN